MAILVIVVVGLFVGVSLGNAISRSVSANTAVSATVAPVSVTRKPITFKGDGQSTTIDAAFSGNYSITWKTTAACVYYADLDPGYIDVFSADAATTGTNNVYSLSGNHHLKVITGPSPECGWTITFTPA